MHSHDRTLIASLGFADPDKKDRRHDLACQYLATPEVRKRIMVDALKRKLDERQPVFESPITKGEGQYRTVIGFIDLLIPFCKDRQFDSGEPFTEKLWIGVEVKIGPVSIGDIIRQINLYREFVKQRMHDISHHWLVATAFPLTAKDVEVLASSCIFHARLGESFERWAEAQQAGGESGSGSLEL